MTGWVVSATVGLVVGLGVGRQWERTSHRWRYAHGLRRSVRPAYGEALSETRQLAGPVAWATLIAVLLLGGWIWTLVRK